MMSQSTQNQNGWEQCTNCGSTDAYVQKAVPKNIMIVSLAITLGIALWFLGQKWWLGMAILVGLALVDFILFQILPNVLVCYKCGRRFSGVGKSDRFRPFDHHIGERYRKQKF